MNDYTHLLTWYRAEEEIILSSKDFPHVKVRDVVEIYHPEVDGSKVLLQVHSLKEEMQTKGISFVYDAVIITSLNPVTFHFLPLQTLGFNFRHNQH